MPIPRDQLANLLKSKEFRAQFVSDQPNEFLPLQIRRLREQHGWTQAELGRQAGMQQERISTLENPDNPGIALSTLKRLAQAFDVGLVVRFVPFSEFVDWVSNLSPGSFAPASFEEELPRWGCRGEQGQLLEVADADTFAKIINIASFRRAGDRGQSGPWTAESAQLKGANPSATA